LAALERSSYITPARYRQAIRATSLHLKPGRIYTRIKQPYFFTYVIDELERQYGANTVREGGLKVFTTIDPRLQRNAIKAIRDILPYRTDPAAAIVSVEPGTGAIRAMTAVVRKSGNQFNLAAQSARQAGSTFKAFVLASAIERGVDPDSTYYTSAPFTCDVGPWCNTTKPWDVHTYDNTYSGSQSVTRATLRSDNSIYAQLTLDVGPSYVWNLARRLGVHMSPNKPVASIGLGSLAATDSGAQGLAIAGLLAIAALVLVHVGRRLDVADVPLFLDGLAAAAALGMTTLIGLAVSVPVYEGVAIVFGRPFEPGVANTPLGFLAAVAVATLLVVIARSLRPFMPDLAPFATRLRDVIAIADPVPAGHAAFAALDAITSRTTATFSLFEQRAGVWLATVLIIAVLVWSVR